MAKQSAALGIVAGNWEELNEKKLMNLGKRNCNCIYFQRYNKSVMPLWVQFLLPTYLFRTRFLGLI